MAAWAATAIRRADPSGFLAWAVDSRCAPVVDDSLLVDVRAEFARSDWKRSRWSPATWSAQMQAYTKLRRLDLDLGLDMQGHSKTALCLRLARPRERFGLRATDAFARRLNPILEVQPDSEHEVDLYFGALHKLGFEGRPERPLMPDLAVERSSIRERVGGAFVTIQTGAGAPDKIVKPEVWSEVAKSLDSTGMRVVVIGGPGDASLGGGQVVDLVGKLSLREAMAAVAESELHLSGDTGTGHVAGAFGVPSVTVFGPTPPEVFRPWSECATVLHKGRDIDLVSASDIVSAARDLLPSHAKAISR